MSLYLIAYLSGRPIAIDSVQVESVVDIGAVTPVPLADPVVKGLAALRSRVVTVIDTYLALGVPAPGSESRRAIVTLVEGQAYALIVESLEDVAPFDLHPLPAGTALQGVWARAARGTIDRDGEPLLVLDLTTLVPGTLAAAA